MGSLATKRDEDAPRRTHAGFTLLGTPGIRSRLDTPHFSTPPLYSYTPDTKYVGTKYSSQSTLVLRRQRVFNVMKYSLTIQK